MAAKPKSKPRGKAKDMMSSIRDMLMAKLAASKAAGAQRQPGPSLMQAGGYSPSPDSFTPGASALQN